MLKNGFSFGGWIDAAVAESLHTNVKSVEKKLSEDDQFMKQALLESMKFVGLSSPNPNVGCVFVKAGKVLTKGATQSYGGLHGERHAISQVSASTLNGSTCYVMLEPCVHQGKQPPCTDALKDVGISNCVFAVEDPDDKVDGKGVTTLKASGVMLKSGILRDEAIAWNYPFFINRRYKKIMFAAKWAQSVNGLLADDSGSSNWISSPTSRSYTHFLRQKYDMF